MSLLTRYHENRSWRYQVVPAPLYRSRETGHADLDLRAILKEEPVLTFDSHMPSGFQEIDVWPVMRVPVAGSYPQPSMCDRMLAWSKISMPDTLKGITQMFLELLRAALWRAWDSRVFHLIYASGGRDSRMIAALLYDIQNEHDLGELKFISHSLESHYFELGMKEIGWNPESYEIWNPTQIQGVDYMRVEPPNRITNGFVGPELKFYSKDIDESKTCLVSGSYFVGFRERWLSRMNAPFMLQDALLSITGIRTIHNAEYYYHFKDVCFPFLDENLINFLWQVPPKYFQNTIGGDVVRDTAINMLGLNSPCYHDHSYNNKLMFNWEPIYMKFFQMSQFCQKFGKASLPTVWLPDLIRAPSALQPLDTLPIGKYWNDRRHAFSKISGLAATCEGLLDGKDCRISDKGEENKNILVERELHKQQDADIIKSVI